MTAQEILLQAIKEQVAKEREASLTAGLEQWATEEEAAPTNAAKDNRSLPPEISWGDTEVAFSDPPASRAQHVIPRLVIHSNACLLAEQTAIEAMIGHALDHPATDESGFLLYGARGINCHVLEPGLQADTSTCMHDPRHSIIF